MGYIANNMLMKQICKLIGKLKSQKEEKRKAEKESGSGKTE